MSTLSWGFELWDKIGSVEDYSNNEVTQLDNLRRYLSEYSNLCVDYGQKQKELADKYIPKTRAKGQPGSIALPSTSVGCFHEVVRIVGEIGIAYENLGNVIYKDVARALKELYKKQTEDLRKQSKAKTDLLNALKRSENTLESSKQQCRNAYQMMMQAKETAERCEKDMNMPRNKVLQANQTAGNKTRDFEHSNKEYASKLNDYNQALTKYHYSELPFWCAQMEIMDATRCKKITDSLKKVTDVERTTVASVTSFIQRIEEAIDKIDFEKNLEGVINTHCSKDWIPGGKELVDFSSTQTLPTSNNFSREQVEARILICRKEVDKREKELLSITGLRDTYKEDTQFEDCNNQIARLHREMRSLKNIMTRLEKEHPVTRSNCALNSQEYTSASTLSSMHDVNRSASLDESGSEEPYSDTDEFSGDEERIESNKLSKLSASSPTPAQQSSSIAMNKTYQGHCTVKFPFTPSTEQLATSTTFLAVAQGEQFYVKTLGDDWSYLQSVDEQRHGFVPTNYLEIVAYAPNS